MSDESGDHDPLAAWHWRSAGKVRFRHPMSLARGGLEGSRATRIAAKKMLPTASVTVAASCAQSPRRNPSAALATQNKKSGMSLHLSGAVD
jgi:hypothetical protein